MFTNFGRDSFARGASEALFVGGKKRCDKQKFVTIAKPCFAHSRNCSIAQGTIEYLVIIGVVVVLSLVVVALIVNLGSVPSQQILSESEKLGNIGGGGIVIVEAVSDFDESGFVVLRNYSGSDLSLTKIKVGENEFVYGGDLVSSNTQRVVDVNDLCVCREGEKNRTCEFEFFYLTQSGLEKKETKRVTVNCVSGVSAGGGGSGSSGSGGRVVKPIPPVEPEPELIVDCFDGIVEIDGVDFVSICTLSDLNQIRDYLNWNYVLMNDIDASETKTWNGSLGWEPIGDLENHFTGLFNGNNFVITDLFIYRPNQDKVGLFNEIFSEIESGNVFNLRLADVNIVGRDYVGGLVGNLSSSGGGISLANLSVTGYVSGRDRVGGLVGNMIGNLNFNGYVSQLDSNIIVSGGDYVGGLIGDVINFELSESYSIGLVSGSSNVGGLVGSFIGNSFGNGSIINSYSQSEVFGSTDQAIGGLVGSLGSDYHLSSGKMENCYSTGLVLVNIEGGSFFDNSANSSSIFFAPPPTIPEVTDSNVGGLIGYSGSNVTVISSYWDMNTSSQETSAGGVGKTIGEMKSGDVFSGWNIIVWDFVPGEYPKLKWQTD